MISDVNDNEVSYAVGLTSIVLLKFALYAPICKFASRFDASPYLRQQIQHVESEVAIAAIERNGGTVKTRFFDPPSLFALRDPEKFFTKGVATDQNLSQF